MFWGSLSPKSNLQTCLKVTTPKNTYACANKWESLDSPAVQRLIFSTKAVVFGCRTKRTCSWDPSRTGPGKRADIHNCTWPPIKNAAPLFLDYSRFCTSARSFHNATLASCWDSHFKGAAGSGTNRYIVASPAWKQYRKLLYRSQKAPTFDIETLHQTWPGLLDTPLQIIFVQATDNLQQTQRIMRLQKVHPQKNAMKPFCAVDSSTNPLYCHQINQSALCLGSRVSSLLLWPDGWAIAVWFDVIYTHSDVIPSHSNHALCIQTKQPFKFKWCQTPFHWKPAASFIFAAIAISSSVSPSGISGWTVRPLSKRWGLKIWEWMHWWLLSFLV